MGSPENVVQSRFKKLRSHDLGAFLFVELCAGVDDVRTILALKFL